MSMKKNPRDYSNLLILTFAFGDDIPNIDCKIDDVFLGNQSRSEQTLNLSRWIVIYWMYE